jgi:hypothetical protein
MNKKGSMELSVNSIVILVIAIVMLGLILGFVKSKFSKLDIAQEEPDPATASAGEPITLSKASLSISSGQTVTMKFGMYNPGTDKVTDAQPIVTCNGGLKFNTIVNNATLGVGENKIFATVLKYNGGGRDQYICTVCLASAASGSPTSCYVDATKGISTAITKEFFVEVK